MTVCISMGKKLMRGLLLGATHEFKDRPLDAKEVEDALKERSYEFTANVWDCGTVDKITSGYRVQSQRSPYGRMPIIGSIDLSLHSNAWIFTGLSGRGLLYHGVFGDYLTNMILKLENKQEETSDLDWWRPKS